MRTALVVLAVAALAGCKAGAPRPADAPLAPGPSAAPSPVAPKQPDDPDEALAMMEEASARAKGAVARRDLDAEAEARRRHEEEMKAKEAARRKMEEEKKGLEGTGARAPGAGAGDEKPLFEEQYAEIINRVRAELQKYKRW